MRNGITTTVRTLMLAAALVLAADARALANEAQTVPTAHAAHTTTTNPAVHDGPPVGGLLIIAGLVVGGILIAWVCSRVSDNRRGNIMS